MAGTKRVLVVGSGAREHALCRAVSGPGRELLIAPGNAGTAEVGRNLAVRADDVAGLVAAARQETVDLVVVGPELPLTLGLVDALGEAKIAAFGPTKAASRLEASKVFMKRLLARAGVPTAPFEVFDDAARAAAYVRSAGRPLVVKADGLAAGKGVVVASGTDEAIEAIDRIMTRREFGEAGREVVVEELLPGREASFHAVCDGERIVVLAAAEDHKQVGDGDRGPNTGGMGAYAPTPVVTDELRARIARTIIEPTLAEMARGGTPFRGVLFAGLMIDGAELRVLEYNVRFGDPETAVLVPLYAGDWLALLEGAAHGRLPSPVAEPRGSCLCVVMAAAGYPGTPRTGDVIHGLRDVGGPGASGEGVFVLHAGTRRREDGAIVTAGGRVLTVGAFAPAIGEASRRAYDAVRRIRWEGEHHRTDIGRRAISGGHG